MALDSKKLLDDIGWQLLQALQENARLSFAELGRRIGLSLPSVAERVRRMEEAGIITGYRAEVDLVQVDLPVMAFIRVSTSGKNYSAFIALVRTLPQVRECHHLTGSDAFLMKVVAASIAHLESLITRLSGYGQTTTSIVLSSPVTKQVVDRDASQIDDAVKNAWA